jgi:hypothetical protein
MRGMLSCAPAFAGSGAVGAQASKSSWSSSRRVPPMGSPGTAGTSVGHETGSSAAAPPGSTTEPIGIAIESAGAASELVVGNPWIFRKSVDDPPANVRTTARPNTREKEAAFRKRGCIAITVLTPNMVGSVSVGLP